MIPHIQDPEELAKQIPEPPEELRPVLYGAGVAGGLVGLAFMAQSAYDLTVTYPQLVQANEGARADWANLGQPNPHEAMQMAISNQTLDKAVETCIPQTLHTVATPTNIVINADGTLTVAASKVNPAFHTCVGQTIAPPKAYHDGAVDGMFLGLTVALTAAAVGFYGAHRKPQDEAAPAGSNAVAGITANLT